MLKHVVESAAVEKLKGIIKDRYGKVLSIQSMLEASDISSGDDSYFVKKNSLHIPIQVHDHYFATAVVADAGTLKTEDQLAISYMVKMVLEPEFYNWYLHQNSHNTQNFKAADNVVSIFTPHDLTQFMDEDLSSEDDEELPWEDSGLHEHLICLEAKNPNLIPRFAYEIHEVSQRWAFLKYNDIQNQVSSIDDLLALGNLTLLIEDVLQISPEHREIIAKYINHESKSERPLLIIGSASQIESLAEQGILESSFAQILVDHRLEAERLPRDSKLLQETLEIMLHV